MGNARLGVPTLLGIPFDGESSYLRGSGDAPGKIRAALRCDAANMWTELGVDVGADGAFEDAGDLEIAGLNATFAARENPHFSQNQGEIRHPDTEKIFAAIQERVGSLTDSGRRPVLLGGDHSITFPIVQAVAKRHAGLTIFHFDAHPDLYDEFEGDRLSHACPFARIMEAGLAKRLVQIGIRTATKHQREQAARFGVEMVEMRALPGFEKLKSDGPIYVTFDMDVLDPAFAPGVSHREPGGMPVREAIAHLHAIEGEIVGADLVEYNPVQDVGGVTATVAAKILKEILGRMIGG
jgi:arginase